MRKCDRQPTIHKSQPLCTTEPTSADSRYHSLAHYQFGHQLCVPVYRGDYVRHQRVSDRQQSFHSWRDVGLLTAEAPAKAAVSYLLLLFLETWQCELQPSHTVYISSLTKKRVEKEYLCKCFTKIGWHYWDLLREIRASHDYIPSPFHLRIGYYGDDLPQSLSSDHYFLSGLVSANCRPAHSVQPNWPNQMLGLRSGLPRHFLTANRIPVIVWALCLHSGISCTLNHRHG